MGLLRIELPTKIEGITDICNIPVNKYTKIDVLIERIAFWEASKVKNFEVYDDNFDIIVMSYCSIQEALVNAVRMAHERHNPMSIIIPLDENNCIKFAICSKTHNVVLLEKPINYRLASYIVRYGISVFDKQFKEFMIYEHQSNEIYECIHGVQDIWMNANLIPKPTVGIVINDSLIRTFNTIEDAIVKGFEYLPGTVNPIDIILKVGDDDKYLLSIENNGVVNIDESKLAH